MAAEARVGHIRVSDTASGNGVGHGRLGYRGVYGSVMCPWFVKGENPHWIIRWQKFRVRQCTTINAVRYTERRAGVPKSLLDGIWYRKRGRDWRTT